MATTSRKPKAKGNSREPHGITPDMVLDAAAKILEEDGLDALTMRRVAGDLGVAPPTVYWHVGNKEELLSQLMDRLERKAGEIRPKGTNPADRIKSVVAGIHHQLRDEPGLHLLSTATGRPPTMYASSDRVLVEEFTKAGLSPEQVGFALHNILTFNASYLFLERILFASGDRNYHFAGPDVLADEFDAETVAAITADADIDAIFDYQLDQLVASLLALGDGN